MTRSRGGWRLLGVTLVAGLLGAGCQGTASTLDPRGPRASQAADLWWIMFWLGLAGYVAVLILLLYAIVRSRPNRPRATRQVVDDNLLIVSGGVVLPLVVLPIVWVVTLQTMHTVATPPEPPDLTIEVVGHQWWYEVRYPQRGATLTNELRLPVGRSVELRVTSADVIHSFWVPRLMGKIDMVPGKVNGRWLAAAEPGRYLVECAEFCGLWHAKMQMSILAQPPAEFDAWLASQP